MSDQVDIKTYVTFAEMVDTGRVILKANHPLLLEGPHGIGKSEVVYQMAKGLGKFCGIEGHDDLEVVEVRTSQMNEGDMLGLPIIDDERGTTEFNPPVWFKKAMEKPCLLFFDEINRAVVEVTQQTFQITDSKRLDQNFLHPETRIVGAVNPSDRYHVAEMDPAELDRWHKYYVQPSLDEWFQWLNDEKTDDGERRIPREVIAFLSGPGEDHIEKRSGMFEPDTIYPSRRSWTRFADCYRIAKEEYGKDLSGNFVFRLALPFVNSTASLEFRDFLENGANRVKPEDIIEGGEWQAAADQDVGQVFALIELTNREGWFEEVLEYDKICHWRKFMINIPQEAFTMALVKMCQAKNAPENIIQLGWQHQRKEVDDDGNVSWVDDGELPEEHLDEFHNYFYDFFEEDEAILSEQMIEESNRKAEEAYKEIYGEDDTEETPDESSEE